MFDLLPNQIEHVAKIKSILDKHKIAFDFSMLGTGKTYTSSHIALTNEFAHVIVVCPLSVAPKWSYMQKQYSIPLHCVVSYNSLRSVKGKQPKHGLLNRVDFKKSVTHWNKALQREETSEVDSVNFTLTEKANTLLQEGTLVVLDEIQNFKNMSAQFEACRTLIKGVLTSEKSRAILLSGSPIDKEEQILRLFRAIDVFKADEIAHYDFATHNMRWTGLKEICNFCRALDLYEFASVRAPRLFASGNVLQKYAYNLFQKVVKPVMSSSMIPMKIPVRLTKMNGFYAMPEEQNHVLEEAVRQLEEITNFNKDSGTVEFTVVGKTDSSFAKITKALLAIENAKTDLFVRLAKEHLESNPNKKVVLCFNYSSTIDYVQAKLREYDPLILDGKTNQRQRTYILDAFQAPHTTYRLLIGNVSVCSTGIDLDDKHGTFPRVAFINPNYSTITLYQLGHRFHRADSKSNSDVFFVYGQHYPELSVLNALSRKSSVMKEITPEQAEAGVVFPVDMPSYYEETETVESRDPGDPS